MPDNEALQLRMDSILAGGTRRPTAFLRTESARVEQRPLFSAFVDEDLEKAVELARTFEKVANEEGLDRAVSEIESALEQQTLAGLVQYAVKIFLTHHPEARGKIKLKPLEIRQPDLVRPFPVAGRPRGFGDRGRAKA